MSDLRAAFVRFRGGNGFVAAMLVYVVAWIAVVHCGLGLDPELSELNLQLSVEASLATCFLIDQQARQHSDDRRLEQSEIDALARLEAGLADRGGQKETQA